MRAHSGNPAVSGVMILVTRYGRYLLVVCRRCGGRAVRRACPDDRLNEHKYGGDQPARKVH